jgi:hypothetical protein
VLDRRYRHPALAQAATSSCDRERSAYGSAVYNLGTMHEHGQARQCDHCRAAACRAPLGSAASSVHGALGRSLRF